MLILERDGSVAENECEPPGQQARRGYAELVARPDSDLSQRINRLISLAFDQLGLDELELRVRDEEAR